MEKKLEKLFDYQKFENNERLRDMIRDAKKTGLKKLSDNELDQVSAAGTGFSAEAENKTVAPGRR